MSSFVDLQRRRLEESAELGPQFEQFAPRVPPMQQPSVLLTAAEAFRATGDTVNELRLRSRVPGCFLGATAATISRTSADAKSPATCAVGFRLESLGEQAADFVIANGDAALVHRTITGTFAPAPAGLVQAHMALPVVPGRAHARDQNRFCWRSWRRDHRRRPWQAGDRNQQLAGDIWYYYGSRYGEYLGTTKKDHPKISSRRLWSESPASASGYLVLADYYAEVGDTHAAIANYRRALELAPGRADARPPCGGLLKARRTC